MSTSATQRRLRLIRSPPPGDERPLEFAVRFAPVRSWLAWLRRPVNSFGWVGRGTVRVEVEGLRVSGRRLTPLGLQRTPRLIRHTEIRDVYRESNAIQLNLRGGNRRAYVRLWAEDAARAARLVALLPTQRTLELETLPRPPRQRQRPQAASLWLLLLIGAALLAFAWFGALRLEHLSAPPAQARRVAPALAPIGPQPAAVAHRDAQIAQINADLDRFTPRFHELHAQFHAAWEDLLKGDLSQHQFASGLEVWLMPQWTALERQLPAADPATPRGRVLRDLQGVIRSWQRALSCYARGLHTQNPRDVDTALASIGTAYAYERAAWYELDQLEWANEHPPVQAPNVAAH
jgi:hypothetical protein